MFLFCSTLATVNYLSTYLLQSLKQAVVEKEDGTLQGEESSDTWGTKKGWILAGPERVVSKRYTMILSFKGCCWRTAADSIRTVAVPLPGAGAVRNEAHKELQAIPLHLVWKRPTAVPGSTGDASRCSPQRLPGVDRTSLEAQVQCPPAALPKAPAPRGASRYMPCTSAPRVGCLTSSTTEPDTKQEIGKNTVVTSDHSCLNFSQTLFFFLFTYREILRICPCNNNPPPPLFATFAK